MPVRPRPATAARRSRLLGPAAVAVLAAGTALAAAVVPAGTASAASALPTSSAATVQTNGRVSAVLTVGSVTYLGGSFTSVRPSGAAAGTGEVARARLAAVDTASGALLPWAPAADGEVDALAASPDGATVYVGGAFASLGGSARSRLGAVSAGSGALRSFAPAVNGKVLALHATASTVYAGGTFTKAGGSTRNRVAALSATTGLASSGWAPSADGLVRSIVPSSDGTSLYLGGAFTHLSGSSSQRYLAKVSASTGAAQSWSSHPSWPVWRVLVTSTSVYVSGDGYGGHVAAYSTGGTRRWVRQTDGGVQALALIGSQVYAGGHFDNLCAGDTSGSSTAFVCATLDAPRRKLLALDAATGATDPWAPGANSALGVFTLGNAAGSLVAGGDFTAAGHLPGKTALLPRQGFAQFRS